MANKISKTAIWEVYKYLSRNVLSEEELDLYFGLTNSYLKKLTIDGLYELINSAKNEKVELEENSIKQYIKELQIKKSLK